MAHSFTGVGWSFMPRFLGLSGWLNTPTTWCPAATRASSEGTANSGVPMNTIFMEVPPQSASTACIMSSTSASVNRRSHFS